MACRHTTREGDWCAICVPDPPHPEFFTSISPVLEPAPMPNVAVGEWTFSPQYNVFHGPDLVISMKLIRDLLASRGLAIVPAEPLTPDANVCWHCLDCLEPAPQHCENCPPLDECDEEGCKEEGCVARRALKS